MRRLITAVLGSVLLACAGAGSDASSALTEEDRADIAFFAGFGFPDVAGKPFGEVPMDDGIQALDGEVHAFTQRGFLLATRRDGALVVQTGEPLPHRFGPSEPDAPAWRRVAWHPLDLAEVVRRRLAGEDQPKATDLDLEFDADSPRNHRFAERLSTTGRVLALAWACARQGLCREAHALLARARESRKAPLREVARPELSVDVIWRLVEGFEDPDVSRETLLAGFQGYLSAFPHVKEHSETAREATRILMQMVEEDRRHALAARPMAEMTKEDRIREWIFRLRDQNGCQAAQPGGPSIFATSGPEGASPAERLVVAGYDAVPFLIDAVGDRRFTRTVGFWRDFTYSHYVVRVGGAAETVLERITGRSFQGADRKRAWRTWWEAFSTSGIIAGLVREVCAGGDGAIEAARALAARSPDGAVSAILRGIENTRPDWARGYLVEILAGIPGDAQLPFMQKEVREGPTLGDRLLAGRWLSSHGRSEGKEMAAALWTRVQSERDPEPDAVIPLVVSFSIAGTEEAARALVTGLPNLPPILRGEAIDWLYVGSLRPTVWAPAEPAAETLLMGYLVSALDDGAEYVPRGQEQSPPPDGETLRVSECAARRLAAIWRGEGVSFTEDAFRADRDRQIRAIRNHAREKQGFAPLPEPPRPDVPLLGNRVREVRVLPSGTDLDAATKDRVESLRGETITARAFAELLDGVARARPAGSRGVEGVLWRPEDGSGVVLTLTVPPSKDAIATGGPIDSEDVEIRVGRTRTLSAGWSGGPVATATNRAFVAELDQALGSPFDVPVRAVVRWTGAR